MKLNKLNEDRQQTTQDKGFINFFKKAIDSFNKQENFKQNQLYIQCVNKFQQQIQIRQKEVGQLKRKIKQEYKPNQQFNKAIVQYQYYRSNNQKQIKQLKILLKSAQQKNKKNIQVSQQLDSYIRNIGDLRTQLNKSTRTIQDLSIQKQYLKRQNQKVYQNRKYVSRCNQDLGKENQGLRRENQVLRRDNQVLHIDNKTLTDKINKIQRTKKNKDKVQQVIKENITFGQSQALKSFLLRHQKARQQRKKADYQKGSSYNKAVKSHNINIESSKGRILHNFQKNQTLQSRYSPMSDYYLQDKQYAIQYQNNLEQKQQQNDNENLIKELLNEFQKVEKQNINIINSSKQQIESFNSKLMQLNERKQYYKSLYNSVKQSAQLYQNQQKKNVYLQQKVQMVQTQLLKQKNQRQNYYKISQQLKEQIILKDFNHQQQIKTYQISVDDLFKRKDNQLQQKQLINDQLQENNKRIINQNDQLMTNIKQLRQDISKKELLLKQFQDSFTVEQIMRNMGKPIQLKKGNRKGIFPNRPFQIKDQINKQQLNRSLQIDGNKKGQNNRQINKSNKKQNQVSNKKQLKNQQRMFQSIFIITQEQNDRRRQNQTALINQISQLKNQMQDLNQKLHEQNSKILNYKQNIKLLQQQIAQMNKVLVHCQQKLSTLQIDLNQSKVKQKQQEQIINKNLKIIHSYENLKNFRQQLSQTNKIIQNSAQTQTFINQITNIDKLSVINDENTKKDQILQDQSILQRITQLETQNSSMNSKIQSLTIYQTQLISQKNSLKRIEQNLQKQIQNKQTAFKKQIQQISLTHQQQRNQFKVYLNEKQQKIIAEVSALLCMQQKIKQKDKKLSQLQLNQTNQLNQITQLNHLINLKEQLLKQTNQTQSNTFKNNQQLQQQKNNLQILFDNLKQENTYLHLKIKQLKYCLQKEQIQGHQINHRNEQQIQIKNNQYTKTTIDQRFILLQNKLKSSNEQMNKFKGQIIKLKQQLNQLKGQLNSKQNEIQNLLRKNHQLLTQSDKYQNQSKDRLQLLNEKIRQNNIRQQKIEQLKVNIKNLECIISQQQKNNQNQNKSTHTTKYIPAKYLLSSSFLHQLPDYKSQQLLKCLEQGLQKKVIYSNLLYRLHQNPQINKKTTPHQFIDYKSNLLLIIKCKNGQIFGGFSSQQVHKDLDISRRSQQFGMIFSLTNDQYFFLKDQPHAKAIVYDDYYFILGNSDIRIRFGEELVYSNFGIGNSFYDCKQFKQDVLIKCGINRQTDIETYEIYQVHFQKTTKDKTKQNKRIYKEEEIFKLQQRELSSNNNKVQYKSFNMENRQEPEQSKIKQLQAQLKRLKQKIIGLEQKKQEQNRLLQVFINKNPTLLSYQHQIKSESQLLLKQLKITQRLLNFNGQILSKQNIKKMQLLQNIKQFTSKYVQTTRMIYKTSLGTLNAIKIIKESFNKDNILCGCLILIRSRANKQFAIMMTIDNQNSKKRCLLINLTNNKVFRPIPNTQMNGFKYLNAGSHLSLGSDQVTIKNNNPLSEIVFNFDVVGQRYFSIANPVQLTGQIGNKVQIEEVEIYAVEFEHKEQTKQNQQKKQIKQRKQKKQLIQAKQQKNITNTQNQSRTQITTANMNRLQTAKRNISRQRIRDFNIK